MMKNQYLILLQYIKIDLKNQKTFHFNKTWKNLTLKFLKNQIFQYNNYNNLKLIKNKKLQEINFLKIY